MTDDPKGCGARRHPSNFNRETSVRYIKDPSCAADSGGEHWPTETAVPPPSVASHRDGTLNKGDKNQNTHKDMLQTDDDGYLATNVLAPTTGFQGDDGYLDYINDPQQKNAPIQKAPLPPGREYCLTVLQHWQYFFIIQVCTSL